MGRIFKYFPPPPPKIEEKHWLDIPNYEVYHVTKLEPIDKADWLIHCIDNDGCIVGIFGCPYEFIMEVKEFVEFKFDVDVSHYKVYFLAKDAQHFAVIQWE